MENKNYSQKNNEQKEFDGLFDNVEYQILKNDTKRPVAGLGKNWYKKSDMLDCQTIDFRIPDDIICLDCDFNNDSFAKCEKIIDLLKLHNVKCYINYHIKESKEGNKVKHMHIYFAKPEGFIKKQFIGVFCFLGIGEIDYLQSYTLKPREKGLEHDNSKSHIDWHFSKKTIIKRDGVFDPWVEGFKPQTQRLDACDLSPIPFWLHPITNKDQSNLHELLGTGEGNRDNYLAYHMPAICNSLSFMRIDESSIERFYNELIQMINLEIFSEAIPDDEIKKWLYKSAKWEKYYVSPEEKEEENVKETPMEHLTSIATTFVKNFFVSIYLTDKYAYIKNEWTNSNTAWLTQLQYLDGLLKTCDYQQIADKVRIFDDDPEKGLPVIEPITYNYYCCFANFIIRLNKETFEIEKIEYTKDIFATLKLKWNYIEEKEVKNETKDFVYNYFKSLIHRENWTKEQDNEVIEMLFIAIGKTLYDKIGNQKMTFHIADYEELHDNGKSLFMELIRFICTGSDSKYWLTKSISAIDFDNRDNKFQELNYKDKLICVTNETNKMKDATIQCLKDRLTPNYISDAESKGIQDKIKFHWTTTFWYAKNGFIEFENIDDWKDKMTVFEFPNCFRDKKLDPNIRDKVLCQEVAEYVILESTKHFLEFLKSRKTWNEYSKECFESKEKLVRWNHSTYEWLETLNRILRQDIQIRTIYSQYRSWCDDNGRRADYKGCWLEIVKKECNLDISDDKQHFVFIN